jgi:hypothetical protein
MSLQLAAHHEKLFSCVLYRLPQASEASAESEKTHLPFSAKRIVNARGGIHGAPTYEVAAAGGFVTGCGGCLHTLIRRADGRFCVRLSSVINEMGV